MICGLNEEIKKYIEADYISFHTPGHKGYGNLNLQYDLTELENLESLYTNTGAVARTEINLSSVYGAKTVISASGSTLCIQTMLSAVAEEHDTIIAERNLHQSAVSAMGLIGINPVWIYPKTNMQTNLPHPITADIVEKGIIDNPSAKAVYITSPDYYGQYTDIESVAKVCKKHNKILLVDGAHGAHFKFLKEDIFPTSIGADICCASLHKTLPTLTGAAILSFSDEFDTNTIKRKMSIFASTSPSYLIMSSVDTFTQMAGSVAGQINDLAVTCGKIKSSSRLTCLRKNADPTRITVDFAGGGYSKDEFFSLLKQHKIMPEFIDTEYCVFIPTISNKKSELNALENFLSNVEIKKSIREYQEYQKKLEQKTTIRKALFSSTIKTIGTDNAEGKVAARIVSVYPPGIPIVIPGEIIDANVVARLKKYRIYNIDVL